MNKKILIIAGLIIILMAVIIAIALSKKNSSSNVINIPGKNQQSVTTQNFISNAPVKYDKDTTLYYDSNYVIDYDNAANYFQITFTSGQLTGLKALRANAEAMLLSKLNINATDACKLNVNEHIQATPVMNLQKYDFPLSFCSQTNDFPGQ
jgi:LPS O-antigen subunit length determinant protein (WzzB/FepE family)